MRFNRLKKMLIGGVAALSILAQSAVVVPVYADETVEGEAPAEEASPDGEAVPEGDAAAEGAEAAAPSGDAVVPGTIVANNGMYIANSFPDSYMPAGFRKQTVAYQGQNIELAYMDASNGLVSLAYLTDASGSFGDFYLCDTSTAEMSDYVRFEGGNDKYIILLDPGSAEVPEGFEPTALSVNGKSVSAWIFTGEASDSKSDDKEKDKKDDEEEASEESSEKDEKKGGLFGLFGWVKPVEAYAGELDLGIGVGAGDNNSAGGDAGVSETVDSSDLPGADEAAGVPADENSGSEDTGDAETTSFDPSAQVPSGADPAASDYFLVYAIDQSGNLGFYLYDSIGQTYIRYVDLGGGKISELEGAKKSARVRLFIIIGLVILLIVLIILLVNMALSGGRRGDDYFDDDDDYEEMKRRVEKKSKKVTTRPVRNEPDDYDDYDDDYDDDYYDDDDGEDVKVYKKSDRRREAQVAPREQLAPRRKAPSQDIDLDDDFSFDFIKR